MKTGKKKFFSSIINCQKNPSLTYMSRMTYLTSPPG